MQKTDLRNINLNLLVVLQALLDRGSVSGAAEQLNLSQPAVSRSLGQLRELFEDELFVRVTHGIVPTARAETLVTPLSEILHSTIDLLTKQTFDPTDTTRIFRVATTDYGATAALGPALNNFMSQAPKAGLEIIPFDEDIFETLASGKVDLALYGSDQVSSNLRSQWLFDEDYVCLVRKGHPALPQGKRAASNIAMTLKDYIAWPHALVTVFGGRRGVVDTILAKQNKTRRVTVWIPYFSVAPLMIANTDAILTIPSRIASAFDDMPSLVQMRAPFEIERFRYFLLWHERADKDPALVWLRGLLESNLNSQ